MAAAAQGLRIAPGWRAMYEGSVGAGF